MRIFRWGAHEIERWQSTAGRRSACASLWLLLRMARHHCALVLRVSERLGEAGTRRAAAPGMAPSAYRQHDNRMAVECRAPNCRCDSPCGGPDAPDPVLTEAQEDVYLATKYSEALSTRRILERCRVRRGILSTYRLLCQLAALGLVEGVGRYRWRRI